MNIVYTRKNEIIVNYVAQNHFEDGIVDANKLYITTKSFHG